MTSIIIVSIIGFVVLCIAGLIFSCSENSDKRRDNLEYSTSRERAIYIAENEDDPEKFKEWQITIRAMYCSCTDGKWQN